MIFCPPAAGPQRPLASPPPPPFPPPHRVFVRFLGAAGNFQEEDDIKILRAFWELSALGIKLDWSQLSNSAVSYVSPFPGLEDRAMSSPLFSLSLYLLALLRPQTGLLVNAFSDILRCALNIHRSPVISLPYLPPPNKAVRADAKSQIGSRETSGEGAIHPRGGVGTVAKDKSGQRGKDEDGDNNDDEDDDDDDDGDDEEEEEEEEEEEDEFDQVEQGEGKEDRDGRGSDEDDEEDVQESGLDEEDEYDYEEDEDDDEYDEDEDEEDDEDDEEDEYEDDEGGGRRARRAGADQPSNCSVM